MKFDILFGGFPASSDRGWLGWSSVALLRGEKNILLDTAGYGERGSLLERLKTFSLLPEDIDIVILSHFHFDHVLNFPLFPNARIVMHLEELNYAKNHIDKDIAIPWELLEYLESRNNLLLVKEEQEIIPGVEILETPGHTPGHISTSFYINGFRYVFTGDAVKNYFELDTSEQAVSSPPPFDYQKGKESIKRIKGLADFVIPGHDRMLRLDGDQVIRAEIPSVEILLAPNISSTVFKYHLTF